METKFTKGEWEFVKDETYPTLHQIWNKTYSRDSILPTYIARTCYAIQSEANAKLIAASPEMFGCLNPGILRRAAEVLDLHARRSNKTSALATELLNLADKTDIAIKKATE